jgi:hypothetical protein
VNLPKTVIIRCLDPGSAQVIISSSFVGRAAFQGKVEALELSGITFIGDRPQTNGSGKCALYLEGLSTCGSPSNLLQIGQCSFRNFSEKGMGIQIKGAKNIRIEDCSFINIGQAPYFHGIYLRRVSDVLIRGCKFEGMQGAAVKVQSIDCGDACLIEDVSIRSAWRGLHFQDTGDIIVRKCSFDDVSQRSISFTLETERGIQPRSIIEDTEFGSSIGLHIFVQNARLRINRCRSTASGKAFLELRSGILEIEETIIARPISGPAIVFSNPKGHGQITLKEVLFHPALQNGRQFTNQRPPGFQVELQ